MSNLAVILRREREAGKHKRFLVSYFSEKWTYLHI
jgi:hypothetical protein